MFLSNFQEVPILGTALILVELLWYFRLLWYFYRNTVPDLQDNMTPVKNKDCLSMSVHHGRNAVAVWGVVRKCFMLSWILFLHSSLRLTKGFSSARLLRSPDVWARVFGRRGMGHVESNGIILIG